MNTYILQWNINGLYQHITELKLLLNQYEPVIICVQETHLLPHHNLKIPNYDIIRKDFVDGMNASGGVAILIKNIIHHKKINLDTTLQVVALQIFLRNNEQPWSICNFYLNPKDRPSQNQLDQLLQQIPNPTIIMGDFNAKNPLWGKNDTTNYLGRLVEQIFWENRDYCIINDGHPTYLQTRNNKIITSTVKSNVSPG